VRHWRIVVLIEDGKALEELLREFRIHRGLFRRRRVFLPLLWSMWNEREFVSRKWNKKVRKRLDASHVRG
jgi:hypothetical protein